MRPLRSVLPPVLLAALLLTACGPPREEVAHGIPFDQVFSRRDVVAAPGTRWQREPPAGERWNFHGFATIACFVVRPLDGPLAFVFRPTPETVGFYYTASWDGTPLLAEATPIPPDGFTLAVPPAQLARGHHELEIRRIYRAEQNVHGIIHDNVFTALGYRLGDARSLFDATARSHLRSLADFLLLGVTTGEERTQESGFLFAGPATTSAELATTAPATLDLDTVNLSESPARFTIEVGGRSAAPLEVAPRQRGHLEVPLPAGRSTLRFRADGADDGWYLWGAPAVRTTAPREPSRPPIVLLTLDTTRRDALGAYAPQTASTPHLDAFARAATVYERAWSTAPWTLPSHASMFTGLYPSRHGAGVSADRLTARFATVAERLRAAGYFTAGFAGGDLCNHRFGVAQGFRTYRDPDGFETPGDRLTDAVAALLEEKRGGPPFVFVNYFDPHAPYRPPPAFARRFDLDRLGARLADQPVWKRVVAGDGAAWSAVVAGKVPLTPAAVVYLRAAYAAEVAFMDEQIGRLFDLLHRLRLYDEALVVVVADHGELLGEDGHVSHGFRLDPELTSVPLLVKWPHQTTPRRVPDLVSGVDVFPTILAAAGLEAPAGDGIPLGPAGDAARAKRRDVFEEEHESIVHPLDYPFMKIASHLYGLQAARFRGVVWRGGESCARESEGVWLAAACPGTWQRLLSRVHATLAPQEGGAADTGELTPEDRARLEALGYL